MLAVKKNVFSAVLKLFKDGEFRTEPSLAATVDFVDSSLISAYFE